MLKKIKNHLKKLKDDTWDYMSAHPIISGYTIGVIMVYAAAIGSSIITGKKWYLEEKH